MQIHIEDRKLVPILEKVDAGARLDFTDGVALLRTPDILSLGYMANVVRERINGNTTWFNVNRHINPTDVCVASCKLCAFGKRAKDPKAYTWSLEEVWHRAGEGWSEAVTEFHIVGGLHPDLTFEHYLEMVRGLKQRCPSVHIKAFTMVEVHYFSRIAKLSIEDVLQKMKAAGVDSCPGGGAEIFHPRVRKIICDHKTSGQMWLSTAKKAHEAGLRSNATMLYGHVETEEERVDHLIKLRGLQDEMHGFVAFIPLAFHPDNTALSHIPKTSGYADLRAIAISRLMLDNFDHIKAYWIMLSPSIAQIALRFGANDLDGTVVEEKIYHDAGAKTSEFTPRAELERLIRAAGRVPVERDTLYRPVDRSKMPPLPPAARPDLVSLTLNV